MSQSTISVLGAGSWGTALAIHLARCGHTVNLWGHREEHIQDLLAMRENARFLPGISFPSSLTPCVDLSTAVESADYLLLSIPSRGFRGLVNQLREFPKVPVVWATKGFDPEGDLLSHTAHELLGDTLESAVISGPTFATEVAQGRHTAVTIASQSPRFLSRLSNDFHNDYFRVYSSADIIGVQVGGAVKNVMAIAAGVADGSALGANVRSALVTRGLAEMMRLGEAMGGCKDTFMGLAGLGDLVLTCTDNQSRNRRFGVCLGRGDSIKSAMTQITQVVEGVQTAFEVQKTARNLSVDMPITDQICELLNGNISALDAVSALFSRQQKSEY
jgi:glycerol-3-phosphate dehydrogenase (NAD(P)+)